MARERVEGGGEACAVGLFGGESRGELGAQLVGRVLGSGREGWREVTASAPERVAEDGGTRSVRPQGDPAGAGREPVG